MLAGKSSESQSSSLTLLIGGPAFVTLGSAAPRAAGPESSRSTYAHALSLSLQHLHAVPNVAARVAVKAAEVTHVLFERAGSETLSADWADRPPARTNRRHVIGAHACRRRDDRRVPRAGGCD